MSETIGDHLWKLDHWTFLLAFVLVLANVVLGRRRVSAAAAALLAVAFGYDVYEFHAESE